MIGYIYVFHIIMSSN